MQVPFCLPSTFVSVLTLSLLPRLETSTYEAVQGKWFKLQPYSSWNNFNLICGTKAFVIVWLW